MWLAVWTLMAAPMPSADAAEIRYEGRSVAAVLEEQRSDGVGLIYSSQLVPDTLRVLREPRARTAPTLITEILAPHGLGISRIAENQYAVVVLSDADIGHAADISPQPRGHDEAVEIVVTSSRYSLADESRSSRTFLTQRQVESLQSRDEPLSAVQRLPGVASSHLSALGYIRGGAENETQIILNGLALHEPFHLKNLLSPVSILHSRLIENIEVYTGGFTAEYGNRLSAVVEAETLSAPDHHELGLSLYSLNALTSGRFAGERGRFLAALHPRTFYHVGSLGGLFTSGIDFNSEPYLDAFAQASYSPTAATRLTLNTLGSYDTVTVLGKREEYQAAKVDYRNGYVWGEVQHDWSERLQGRWLVSLTTADHDRQGEAGDPAGQSIRIADSRSYEVFGLKFDGEYAGERIRQRWGMEARLSEAHYRYTNSLGRDIALKPEVWEYGLYASGRFRPLSLLTVEMGLRWDRQTYAGVAQTQRPQDQLSPRLNLLYELSGETRLRGSWGRYFQPQGIGELQVEDGIEQFFPAQRVNHTVVSLERNVSPLVQLRIEAYRKDYSQLRPRYENLFDPRVLLPEVQTDRVRIAADAAQVRAIEVMLQAREVSPLNWWLSYTLARAVDRIDDREERRSWDQPQAIQAGLGRSGTRWDWTAAINWHSGWPRTMLEPLDATGAGGFAPGPRNATRFGDFVSVDVRVGWRKPLSRGELLISAEVSNLLDRENECCVRYSTTAGADGPRLNERMEHWLPLVPSVGALWKF